MATPFAPVVAIAVFAPEPVDPANVALGPTAGAVNVTAAPLTGFEKLSTTRAFSGDANAVPTDALCPDPEETEIAAGGPARLVSTKAAGVTPETEAVTW